MSYIYSECILCNRKFDDNKRNHGVPYHVCNSVEQQQYEIMHTEWLIEKANKLLCEVNHG